MNAERFSEVAANTVRTNRGTAGIGTLGERTLHAALKAYYEPNEACHEVRIGRYVADICRAESVGGGIGDGSIVEIQTRGFSAMRKKLAVFLEEHEVTVVYPVAQRKWICWIDEQTGEVSKRRRSPKTGQPYAIFLELYRIKELLLHPHLHLCIPLLELEEYRRLNGWSHDKKRGSERHERIPIALLGEVRIDSAAEYGRLIPETLTGTFTSKDFAKASGLSLHAAQTAVHVLHYVGAVIRIGKKGNGWIYKRGKTDESSV